MWLFGRIYIRILKDGLRRVLSIVRLNFATRSWSITIESESRVLLHLFLPVVSEHGMKSNGYLGRYQHFSPTTSFSFGPGLPALVPSHSCSTSCQRCHGK